jgi:hypothetical protein
MTGNDYAERLKATSNARQAAMAAASPTPSPNNANTVGEKMKEIHNARQAKMAAASPTSSPNNANTVGEKMKAMHNARQARIAAAPDIPAGKANRNLLEDVQKSPPLNTPPPIKPDEQNKPPSISEQVKTVRKMREDEKKKQKRMADEKVMEIGRKMIEKTYKNVTKARVINPRSIGPLYKPTSKNPYSYRGPANYTNPTTAPIDMRNGIINPPKNNEFGGGGRKHQLKSILDLLNDILS